MRQSQLPLLSSLRTSTPAPLVQPLAETEPYSKTPSRQNMASAEFVGKAAEFVRRLACARAGTGTMRSRCCCRTDAGSWGCRVGRRRCAGVAADYRRGIAGSGRAVPGGAADAGDDGQGFVAGEHAVQQARVPLGRMEGGSAEWTRVRVTATECPQIPASFLDAQRAKNGVDAVRAGVPLRVQGFGGELV
jgi:hypothetical protein